MEAIGLHFNEMLEINTFEFEKAHASIQEKAQAFIALSIRQGNSREEAAFKAGIKAAISAHATAVLAVIDANNQRLFSDLDGLGLLNR